jgi:hypothetical protein
MVGTLEGPEGSLKFGAESPSETEAALAVTSPSCPSKAWPWLIPFADCCALGAEASSTSIDALSFARRLVTATAAPVPVSSRRCSRPSTPAANPSVGRNGVLALDRIDLFSIGWLCSYHTYRKKNPDRASCDAKRGHHSLSTS